MDKLPAIMKKNLNRELCTCNIVTKMDIIRAIVDGASSLAEVKKETYASMGSGCCAKQIEDLIKQIHNS